ncbi:MAG: hypothetical protein SFU53_08045 [Terrimicrobiaceae bacterium]|nr:hypothetical protein [Terrimicrobiaceae bacterium]
MNLVWMDAETLKQPRRHYIRPPIAERVATVWGNIDEEHFLTNFESWREQVQRAYPHYEPHKEWLIMVKERDGVPLYDTLQPELRITHRFARKSDDGRREFGMRCPQDSLAFHLFTRPDVRHGYATLFGEIQAWLPQWMRHFSVQQVTKVNLYYANLIDPETAKPFVDNGQLELQKVLRSFLALPGAHEALIPPYDCTATVLLSENPKSVLTFRIHGDTETRLQPTVRVDFGVEIFPEKAGLDADGALRLFDYAHERILERFELVFTEEAKQFFSSE